ncbi:MAG TPA: Maf family protein [Nitrospira sp.]
MRVVLASTSPRRRALLALLGIVFEVRNPSCEELLIHGTASELAAYFAQAKAYSVAKDDPDAIVLGSDTLIELDGAVIGKPGDMDDAEHALRLLAGRRHLVHTAVTVSCLTRLIDTTQLSTAHVWMKPYDRDAHARYLATKDCLGKAGSYSIQGPGSDLIQRLEGDFPTVVGFPLRLIAGLLKQVGVPIRVDVEELYKTKPYENWARFSEP